jgi:hypothetical protein
MLNHGGFKKQFQVQDLSKEYEQVAKSLVTSSNLTRRRSSLLLARLKKVRFGQTNKNGGDKLLHA